MTQSGVPTWELSSPFKEDIAKLNELGLHLLRRGFYSDAQSIAQGLLTYLVPFSEQRETGNIEEQLAEYDLKKLLPFTINTELRSDAAGGRRIHATAQFDRSGSLTYSKVDVE